MRKLFIQAAKRPLCACVILLFIFDFIAVRFFDPALNGKNDPEAEIEGAYIALCGTVTDVYETDDGLRLDLSGLMKGPDLLELFEKPEIKCLRETSSVEDVSFSYASELTKGKKVQIFTEAADIDPQKIVGSRVLAAGEVSCYETARNPGNFDSFIYHRCRGEVFCLRDASILACCREINLMNGLRRLRNAVRNIYTNILPARDAGVLCAVTLGDRTLTDPEIKALYQDAGIAHILAVSGLHIQMIGASVYEILRRRRLSFALCFASAGSVLILYCIMTGMSTSAVRSVIMFIIRIGADVLGRESDIFTSLSAAALVLLIKNPYLTQDAYFYLSFGSILSISLLSEPLRKILPRRLPGREAICTSMAVTIGMMPVMCWFYYQITPWSVLFNLAVIPCMSLLFAAAAAGGFGSLLLKGAGIFIAAPCHYLLGFFEILCRLSRKLPLGVVITGRPSPAQMAGYYLLLGLFAYKTLHPAKRTSVPADARERYLLLKKLARRRMLAGWATVILGIFVLLFRMNPDFSAVFIDVGQGDCALLRTGRYSFLIDCGSSSVSDVWERRVSDCLKYYNVDVLDGIFVSHGDEDHINGISSLLEKYDRNLAGFNASDVSVRCLYCSKNGILYDEALKNLMETTAEKKIQTRELDCFDELKPGKVSIACLYPSAENAALSAGDANINSLVLMAEGRHMKVIFTGDLEKEGEERFIKNYILWTKSSAGAAENKMTVLKAGHHGSANATGEELLKCVKPHLAVVSCGKNNIYGHPSPEAVARIKRSGASLHRTDMDGAAVIYDE